MKFLFKILLIGLIALLAYNYFLGTPKEKEQSREIVEKVEDLGRSIASLIRNEKEKFDEGKYDETLGKIGALIQSLKDKSSKIDLKEELDRLNKRKEELTDRIGKIKNDGAINREDQEKLDRDLEDLVEDLRTFTKTKSF